LPRLKMKSPSLRWAFLFDEKLKNELNVDMVASTPFRGGRYGKRSIG
jgi:hypothetical protein